MLKTEKATHEMDLPHEYAATPTIRCSVCGHGPAYDLHAVPDAREQAAEHLSTPSLQRELGS